MKMTLTAALLAGLMTLSSVHAQSAVPSEMAYQATVTDASGNLVGATTAEDRDVIVRIFSAGSGGTLLWAERHTSKIFEGRFSVVLGQGNTVAITGGTEPKGDLAEVFTDKDRFIELTLIDGLDTQTFSPRQKLVASATAFRARVADTIVDGAVTSRSISAGGIDSSKISGVTSPIQGQLDTVQTQVNTKASLGSPNFTGPIQVYNGIANPPEVGVKGGSGQRLVLWPGTATTRPFGFGINGNTLWSAVPVNATHQWHIGDTERMRISSNGNVGIGTSNPNRGKLHVNGFNNVLIPATHGVFNQSASQGTFGATTRGVSIYSEKVIWCNDWIVSSSDARIKTVKGISDKSKDLEALLGIEITDYQYKDTLSKGQSLQKKVIAQQVENFFPQAVSRQTNIIPDLYQNAPIKEGWITLETTLTKGEKVKLITEKSEGIYEVLELKPGKFRTTFSPESDQVFVYGREVDDFRTVDYDAIAMLNVSATQEIYRESQALKKQVGQMEARLIKMEALVQTMVSAPVPVISLKPDLSSQ